MFDLKDPAAILLEINDCRKTFASHYIRVTAFDSTQGVESVRMSYIVNRPAVEPGFRLVRSELGGRNIGYGIESYSVQAQGEGERY
jgi:ribulose-bisphosphate carboxylase small chain